MGPSRLSKATGHAAALIRAPGADVDLRGVSGSTALMAAAFRGNEEIVEALVEGGADPTRKNREKETAQQIAQRKEHWAVAKYLKIEGLNWLKEHDKDL